ncbi:MAG: triose-phosphate isomerase [Planctomycetia bacterium]|nr:MAG: triose-phosphate isomerase [Planctomycetia bacterium]
MPHPLIAGNWKMNLDRARAVNLAERLVRGAGRVVGAELAVCPPGVYLEAVGGVVRDSPVGLGAQNAYHELEGAFTGETSVRMLLDLGCRYVILGHSERRHILGESDRDVNQKLKVALAAGLVPIVCVGERLDERERGETGAVIRRQYADSLAGVTADEIGSIIIAYEPVWAIGTGKVATPETAEEVHADLRTLLEADYNKTVAGKVRLLYGGSVKPDNAGQLLAQANIDGALVGGASLDADSFLAIAAAAAPV